MGLCLRGAGMVGAGVFLGTSGVGVFGAVFRMVSLVPGSVMRVIVGLAASVLRAYRVSRRGRSGGSGWSGLRG